MQPESHWQAQTLARFIHTSRLYLGLTQPSVIIKPPHRIAAAPRQILRSLVVAGSLGTLFGSPVYAGETSRQTEPAKRSQNMHSSRIKADDQPAPAHRLSIPGKYR